MEPLCGSLATPPEVEPCPKCSWCGSFINIGDLSLHQRIRVLKGRQLTCAQCKLAKSQSKKEAKREESRGFCFYCGGYGRMTKDHVIPKCYIRSREIKIRSADIPIVYCCGWCNSAKASKDVFAWLSEFPADSP
jgi:hypothetical protein